MGLFLYDNIRRGIVEKVEGTLFQNSPATCQLSFIKDFSRHPPMRSIKFLYSSESSIKFCLNPDLLDNMLGGGGTLLKIVVAGELWKST